MCNIQQETGIPMGTLKKWRMQIRDKGFAAPASNQKSEQWSTRDKYLTVVETAILSEIELAEYCRKKGMYVEQVRCSDHQHTCVLRNRFVIYKLRESSNYTNIINRHDL